MIITNLPAGFAFASPGAKIDAPAVAREFEALLIARLLKTARQAGQALSAASTQTGAEGYMELAEEHLARVMAQRGAFGISQLVLRSLDSQPDAKTGSAAGAYCVLSKPLLRRVCERATEASAQHETLFIFEVFNTRTAAVMFSTQPSIRRTKEKR